MFGHFHSHLPSPGKNSTLLRFNSLLAAITFLGFAFVGFCDEFKMVSLPLGFRFDNTRIWVSQNGLFQFGFLETNDAAGGFVLGIRHNLGDIKTGNWHVWSAGGGVRVSMNSTFTLSLDGRLLLCDKPSALIVWSSNTSNMGVQKASLLNNGNLVLTDVHDNLLWQSFDSPTNALLPGQSLHFPQNLRAPWTNSISSYYTFVIRRSGELALLWENNVTYWSSSSSLSSSIISKLRFNDNGTLGLYDSNEKMVWFVQSIDFDEVTTVFRHLRIDPDGNLRIYYWDNLVRVWRIGWQAVDDQCRVFGTCGLYSLCGYNSTRPVCKCLLFSDSDYGGIGCRKMVDLGSCEGTTSMSVMRQTVLYGLYPPNDVDLLLSQEDCKQYCSRDSTCVAVTSRNDGSGICTVKRTGFISGYRGPFVPATSFLKGCLIPQAVEARRPDNVINVGSMSGGRKKIAWAVFAIILITVGIIAVMEISVILYLWRRGREVKDGESRLIPLWRNAQPANILVKLSFEEVKKLTDDFAIQIGPSTFRGSLDKMAVIAKVLNDSPVPEKDFCMTVSILCCANHRNLVPLRGFCLESTKGIVLVYQFIENVVSLDKWLFDSETRNWEERLEIGLGIARALAHLHLGCQKCIPHGNLKVENVLLDQECVPKLTDYGVESLVRKQSSSSNESLPERDIYMLGEMLLQIVTCKRDIRPDKVDNIVGDLRHNDNEWKGVERVVRIALWCMQSKPFLRPSISEVVKVLEGTLSVDKPPSRPDIRTVDHEIIDEAHSS
ncbi:G-type lectin S-receptor-like serine/threonine-protein kinase SD3-1 [Impatiens glandulifera]|uniref:G-type lectin S-receptor-like serine/threonine-protein kinase SD3-1 n=1 Tax=Impatiens glandulifera TaxID=253017 RepID=UPI001FB14A9A|nr:G-type lectin S-receptor-like serine/threonine-protein kinase SD3-1 [Impatiens glandulifera]